MERPIISWGVSEEGYLSGAQGEMEQPCEDEGLSLLALNE